MRLTLVKETIILYAMKSSAANFNIITLPELCIILNNH